MLKSKNEIEYLAVQNGIRDLSDGDPLTHESSNSKV